MAEEECWDGDGGVLESDDPDWMMGNWREALVRRPAMTQPAVPSKSLAVLVERGRYRRRQ